MLKMVSVQSPTDVRPVACSTRPMLSTSAAAESAQFVKKESLECISAISDRRNLNQCQASIFLLILRQTRQVIFTSPLWLLLTGSVSTVLKPAIVVTLTVHTVVQRVTNAHQMLTLEHQGVMHLGQRAWGPLTVGKEQWFFQVPKQQ